MRPRGSSPKKPQGAAPHIDGGRGFGVRQAWDQILFCHFLAARPKAGLMTLLSSVSSSVKWETTSGSLVLMV